MTVRVEREGAIITILLCRPERRNAVDRATAEALAEAFRMFENDPSLSVAVLAGEGGNFCAGADLKAVAEGDINRVAADGDGPMGPSRMLLSKPVIAAISGFAVAGGLELACLCDLRIIEEDAQLGVLCRRFGVPLIDGGTVRLPQIIGLGRALDLILTGRLVDAHEALAMGLATKVVARGAALAEALALANLLCGFPQQCMRKDRLSAYRSFDLERDAALAFEFEQGVRVLSSEGLAGAMRFASGEGRNGRPTDDPGEDGRSE